MINDIEVYTNEIYKKNNIIYTRAYSDSISNIEDTLWDLDTKKEIIINHIFKKIYIEDLKGDVLVNPVTSILVSYSEEFKNTDKKYKYYGEDNNILRFSLSDELGYISYYYIDTQLNNLIKIENGTIYNNEFTLSSTTTYSYSYDSVTDNDILTFDVNNFPDYEYIEE